MTAREEPRTPDPRRPGWTRAQTKDLFLGLALVLALHVVIVGGLSLAVQWVPVVAIGVVQLLYVLPAIAWASTKGRRGLVVGIVLAAALTLLLNGGCFVFVMLSFGR